MNRLTDYSGQFQPDIKFEDFSKDTLVALLKLYSRLYLAIDGFWYLSVKERVSNDEALLCDMWVWEKQAKYEMSRVTKLLNIQGNNVATLMKSLQMSLWFSNFDYNIKLMNDNHSVLTITYCPTLEALEKEGQGREESVCKVVEPAIFRNHAEFVNPDIKVKELKLPPRKSKDEICCQWEFKLV